MAAAVEGFADQENGAAVFGGLVAQELDGEAQAVEDGGAVVAEADVVDGEGPGAIVEVMLTCASWSEGADGVGRRVGVRGEVLEERGLAVEGDYGDFVSDIADDRFKHRSESRSDGGELIELTCACAADFDDDDESERLATGVLLEYELLRDAVVGKDEVFCGKGVDELSGFAADERGNQDKGGVCAEGGGLRGFSRGRGLR